MMLYFITQKQWNKIPDSYKMEKDPEHGAKACFLCYLTPDGSGGNNLCFEHQHFEIIPEKWIDYNPMCLDCSHFEKECDGTKSKVWTGCVLKDRPADEVKEYIDHMTETLERGTAK